MSGLLNDKKRLIHIIIMISLMLFGGFLPPFGQITPMGMKILGVFLGLLYGWVFVDVLWPSVLGFFTLSLTGWTTPLAAVAAGFGNMTTTLVIMSYAFAFCLGRIGVSDAIAYWVLGRKAFVGKPWILLSALAFTALVIGILGGQFAGIFMMWGVVSKIAEVNGVEKGNLAVSMIYAVILYAGINGMGQVPFMSGVLLFGGFFTKATGLVVEGPAYFFLGQLSNVLIILGILLVTRFIFRADASKFTLTEEMRQEYAAYKVNSTQKIGLFVTVLYFIGLMAPSVLKGGIWSVMSSWSVVGFSILYLLVFQILSDDEGKPLCSMADCFQQGVAWGPVLLFMITVPVATAMESAEIGIIATVSELCNAIFAGMSPMVMLIVVAIAIGFLTQILHNLVVAAVLMPVLAPIFVSIGGNPITFFFVMYSALICSYATPAASMQAALIFAKEDIPTGHSYIMGFLYYFVMIVITIALVPLANMLFAGYPGI